MKKVLIIAYHFPPARTAGIYRPIKFAKYLPQFGWEPVILTIKNPDEKVLDESLLKELPPNTKIYRAFSFELGRLENWLYGKIFARHPASPSAWEQNQSQTAPSSNPPGVSPPQPKPHPLKRYIFTPIRRLLQNVVHTPDDKIGWIPFATLQGIRAIRREKIDVIFSTSPPESGHIIARRLSKLTGRPFIADFRDPFTTHYTKQNLPILADSLPYISPGRLRRERKIEKKILGDAGFAVHTGQGRAKLVMEAFPEISSDKHRVITNGYDEADFDSVNSGSCKEKASERVTFVNIGQIYIDAPFGQLLRGAEQALTRETPAPDIGFQFIGDQLADWEDVISQPVFSGRIERLGFRPHKETIRLMTESDVLLLMLPEGDARMRDKIIAGKTFELMRSGRPILMIGWEGESSRMIEESGLGRFVSCENINAISETLTEYYRKKKNGTLAPLPNWEYIQRFERKALTGELARLFDSLIEKKRA